MSSNDFTIQIGGRTYSAEDIEAGRHHDDPAITEPGGSVVNVQRGSAVVGIQAGVITGDITFD
ncbi:hypothetical protein [Saccharopolyspora sp. SCSIO 74807]|uniref:hypothetical protein n=1 Tax=Saccharopolyspora sp. SCSIO 74807 TaxID=3118084 RepID=UPI0030D354C7